MRILVTGSSGYIAGHVIPLLISAGHQVSQYDLPKDDVLSIHGLRTARQRYALDACIHLAGQKYADRAETEVITTVDANIRGTNNVVQVFGANVVLASTCKAADPETVYGSSKLIAERIVLAAGGRVVRFVNVLGSAGSVTDIWGAVPEEDPLPVCHAVRLFISAETAAQLMVDAMDWPTGRYGPRETRLAQMDEIAQDLYPGRPRVRIPLRRGDRFQERLLAACERYESWDEGSAVKIVGQHDPEQKEQESDSVRSSATCR